MGAGLIHVFRYAQRPSQKKTLSHDGLATQSAIMCCFDPAVKHLQPRFVKDLQTFTRPLLELPAHGVQQLFTCCLIPSLDRCHCN